MRFIKSVGNGKLFLILFLLPLKCFSGDMNYFIQTICANVSNPTMCSTSLQQAAAQSGANDTYNQFTKYIDHQVKKETDIYSNSLQEYAKDIYNGINKNIILVVGFTYQVYHDNGFVFTLHPRFANDVSCELHPNAIGFKIKWIY